MEWLLVLDVLPESGSDESVNERRVPELEAT